MLFFYRDNELFAVLVTLIDKRGEGMNAGRLVKRAKKGDKEALLQLIMSEQDTYYRLALAYMGNKDDAMEAMEEMTVILYEKIGQLRKEEAFYSWSKTILVNCCKSLLQKRGRLVLLDDWGQEDERGVVPVHSDDPFRHNDQHMDIQVLLLRINEHQREAIQLKYFHDLDYRTIAEMTNVSLGTVKSRIFQGLKKLRDHYGGEADEKH